LNLSIVTKSFLTLTLFVFTSVAYQNCGKPAFEVAQVSDNQLLLESSHCQINLDQSHFTLAETISISVKITEVSSLSYNLNQSHEWTTINLQSIDNNQIRISAANLGVGNYQIQMRAQSNQNYQLDCQGLISFQIHSSVIDLVNSSPPSPTPAPSLMPITTSTPNSNPSTGTTPTISGPTPTATPNTQTPTNIFIDKNKEYQPVVGPSNKATSFKEANNPFRTVDDSTKSYFVMQSGGYPNTLSIRYRVDGTTNSKLKLFFPPGTISFAGSLLLADFPIDYPALPPAGVMRMNIPPQTPISEITLDKAMAIDNSGGYGGEFGIKILTNLYTPNKEVYFFVPPRAGGLPISFGGYALSPAPREAGWVYGHFQYPTGRAATGNFGISVDKDCYINWYNNAKWDADGNPIEGIVHKCSP